MESERLNNSIVGPLLPPSCEHFHALQASHEALPKTVKAITGRDAAFMERDRAGYLASMYEEGPLAKVGYGRYRAADLKRPKKTHRGMPAKDLGVHTIATRPFKSTQSHGGGSLPPRHFTDWICAGSKLVPSI